MEFVSPTPELEAMMARRDAELTDRIRRCRLPLVGLAEPAPRPRMVGQTSGMDEVIESVGLGYGDPMRAEGPLVQVHTAGRDDPAARSAELPRRLEQELDVDLDDASVATATEDHALVIDGAERPATVLRAGTRFWAAQCEHGGVRVTVVARDWDLESTRLVTITDVEEFLRGRREYLDAVRAVPFTPPEPVDVADPHRALVEASLHDSQEVRERVSQGRQPRSRNMRVSGGLWEAATRAQMHLADQSRDDANEAVTAMINQLTDLQLHASWFATDDAAREAAVTETLMYWTGLREAVPSRAAQEAWRHAWQAHRQQRSDDLFADDSRSPDERAASARRWFEQRLADRQSWLDAWDTWRRTHPTRPGPS